MPAAPVQRENPLTAAGWDRRVAGLPDATCFHTAGWAAVLHHAYGCRPFYLTTATVAGNLVAALPLMEVDSWLSGRRGVSLPFSDTCAASCNGDATPENLLAAAIAEGRARRWRYLELRSACGLAPTAVPYCRYHGHRIDLQQPPAALFAACRERTRRAVRRAERSGVSIEFSQSLASVRSFYELHGVTRRRHGVPPQPFRFFDGLHHHLLARHQGWVVLARHEGRPVAGALFLHFGRHALYKYSASLPAARPVRANHLVLWRALEWYAQHGFASLDLGRTATGHEGLRQFKLGWNPEERRIDYFRLDPRSGRFLTGRLPSTDWTRRFVQVLPLSLARWVGATLYRHAA